MVLPSFCVDLVQKDEILSNKSSCFPITFKKPETVSHLTSVSKTLSESKFV